MMGLQGPTANPPGEVEEIFLGGSGEKALEGTRS